MGGTGFRTMAGRASSVLRSVTSTMKQELIVGGYHISRSRECESVSRR